MEKQTIIFTALPNGLAADGSPQLSVFVSPRLWSDDASLTRIKLSQFQDFLDWTNRISTANWKVTFDGLPALNATVTSDPPRADLWNALFKADTDVIPYRFQDHRGATIDTFSTDLILDSLVGVYTRAASDPALGGGSKLPPIGELAKDPTIKDIGGKHRPDPVPDPPPRSAPVDMGGTLPRPTPEPPTKKPSKGCCLWGCLLWPFLILATPFPKLKGWLKSLCVKTEPEEEPPVFSTDPKPVLPPSAPAPPDPPAPPPPPPPAPPGPASPTRQAFNDLGNFLSASGISRDLPTAAELQQKYDFHQMISALGDYPLLLRQFGIVIDLVVPLGGAAPAGTGTVKVAPDPPLVMVDDTTIVSPRTHYELKVDAFTAAPRPINPEISNGLLRLNDTNLFFVAQVDVVGAGSKLQTAANHAATFAEESSRAPNMPSNVGLPALRTAGISVIRRNLKEELQERFSRSHALQQAVALIDLAPQLPPSPDAGAAAAPSDELFAEDLVHGYRIDVFDKKSNRWHSLCQRIGTYDFLDAPAAPTGKIQLSAVEDEGFVQFAATEPLDKPAKETLKTRDSLFVWDGWSLVAPRPGKTIMKDEPTDPPTVTLDTPKNTAATNFKMETSFSAKSGSLPRFRFDHTYRLRARVCDLAGNSVFGPNDLVFANDVAEQTSDFPCARYEPVSPPAMMLREEPVEGESLEHLVVRSPAVAGESPTTERHIVPPKVSELMAEQHGKFDLATQKMDSSIAGYNRAAREAGSLNDAPATEVKKDVWVNAGDQFNLTYLPDPAAKGALLLGLPGMADDNQIIKATPLSRVNQIPFDGAWPDSLPFRLRLVAIPEGAVSAQPKWEDSPGNPRVLIVELPKSHSKVVRLSCYMASEDLDRQGVLQWTRDAAPANLPQIEADTEDGRTWLHSPWREITLVHAVQKPLKAPSANVDTPAGKKLGETFATITGTVTTHSLSTGKVDLRAKWTDPVDDPTQPLPGTADHQSYLCEVMIESGVDPTDIRESAKHQFPLHNFHDTKYHRVNYTPTATTRFREYFPTSITNDPTNITVEGPPSNTVEILNSARPDMPKVLYIIPTYEWKDDLSVPGKTTRSRKGGLRVYLERSWFSSGDGELLGVVFVDGKPFISLDEQTKKVATQWGVDPIWLTAPSAETATPSNFKGAVKHGTNLSLEGTAQAVAVAGYKPEFDSVRKLWFADLDIDVGKSYMPFVRLALARYQPHSVKDAELSKVVPTDFVQIAMDRIASITTTTAAASANFKISVEGPTYMASSATPAGIPGLRVGLAGGRAEIEALLQTRSATMGDDPDLGWDTAAEITLTPDPVNLGQWSGELNIAEALTPSKWRIMLKEYEWYRSDFKAEADTENMSFARRIVYAAAIPLG